MEAGNPSHFAIVHAEHSAASAGPLKVSACQINRICQMRAVHPDASAISGAGGEIGNLACNGRCVPDWFTPPLHTLGSAPVTRMCDTPPVWFGDHSFSLLINILHTFCPNF